MELVTHKTFLILCCVLFSYSVRVQSSPVLSQNEDFKLEKQLKLINKPAVKILQTINGDTYGCVDFYKQPAFDHPALKNHSYHYKMTSTYNKKKDDPNVNNISFGSLWKNGKGCPTGTVPIRRYTKEELRHANAITQIYADSIANSVNTNDFSNHFAIAHINRNLGKKYNGAGMKASIHNPSVRSSQISASRLMIGKGQEFIQVGMMVNPSFHGDTLTHLFMFTKTPKLQCYNQLCTGFISVAQDIPPGLVYNNISKLGELRSWTEYLIWKDSHNGNWFLDMMGITIGFWPSNIFNDMINGADYIDWGGVTVSPNDVPSPPMGYGNFPPELGDPDTFMYYASYCSELKEINEGNKIVNAGKPKAYMDNDKGYISTVQEPGGPDGTNMYYGGPGQLTG